MTDLKPCPVCGSLVQAGRLIPKGIWEVRCINTACQAHMTDDDYWSLKERWNKRVSE